MPCSANPSRRFRRWPRLPTGEVLVDRFRLLIGEVLLDRNGSGSGMLGCGSFVRGQKRKKGDSIPFILSRRDYMSRLHDECP